MPDPHAILARAASGELPANVALMQLIAATSDPAELEAALTGALAATDPGLERRRVERMALIWRETPAAWDTVKAVIAEADLHLRDPLAGDTPSSQAELFDRLAVLAPDAGTALYALGRADIADRATASIVARLGEWGLVRPDSHVLDLGCGAGRVSLALAPLVGSIVGVDVSTGMLAQARARRRGVDNAVFCWTNGHDLAGFGDRGLDLVLAVDVLPYVVASGEAALERVASEARRVLKPGGALVAFNLSYQHQPDEQRAIAAALAAKVGLRLVRNGTRDVDWWDGLTFHLERPYDSPAKAEERR